MDYLLDSDFYEVQVVSLITNIDRDVLIDLYQPLVGANAVMLYLTLYKKSKEDDSTDFYTMSDLFATMNLSAGQIVDARKALEAVGLIQTYFKNEQELRYFIFEIFAPKSPKDFFDDVLFNGLLISYVGEKNAEKLAFKYQLHRRLIQITAISHFAQIWVLRRLGMNLDVLEQIFILTLFSAPLMKTPRLIIKFCCLVIY